MTFFHFQDPWLLLFLGLIPLLMPANKRSRKAFLHYSSLHLVKSVRPAGMKLAAVLPQVLRLTAIVLLVLALARPQEGRQTREILSPGVDIILAVDTSGSMRALDFFRNDKRVNRLDIVKEVAREFVLKRENDRLGMVAFGSEAFTQCPLTLDHDIFLAFLKKLQVGIAGDSTAIGSAIGIAVKRLKDLKSQSKVIILLTDGRNNAGNISPMQAAEIATTFGIKIYTIGVGTRGKAPFLVDSIFGQRYIYQDVDLDEDTLKKIADMTGAKYFRATDRKSLENIYAQIDRLEKTEVRTKIYSEYTELFPYFLVPALLLVLTEVLLVNTRLRRFP